jgi:anti-anti-sigma factor
VPPTDHLVDPTPKLTESGALRIETGPELETCLVRLEGELDLESGPALERELRRLLDQDLETVAVDLGGLQFIDSTGIQTLVRAARFADGRAETLCFMRPRGEVAKVFRLTGMSEALRFV